MLNKNSLKELLSLLKFSENWKVWEKTVNWNKFFVDFDKWILWYPKWVIINDKTTSNFDKPENFVVFECVHRLVEKWYRPEHIELEKKWTLWHDAKWWKADICVTDENGNMLLIIECKTAWKEYNKAWKDTNNDWWQVFSYWQQERWTKRLSLYCSDIEDWELIYINDIINCSDDANVLLVAKKDDSILLYKNAKTAEELFNVWDETYWKQSFQWLIFWEDTQAYKIWVKPLRKKDLRDFKPEDRIVNRFEEILRHNNVSDKENAFNRLIALFIWKLYDEITKWNNDEVEFQYKVWTDTYETLQDRLQRLHRDWMRDFMEEEISYIENDYAEKLFANKLDWKQRKAAIEDLQNTIRILKFYSNNDFSFKDVHNEELFLQNWKILVEMVQLFEQYRIVYQWKQQFLWDLFEQLLNKGFKQNEWQFFTPTPITRYIWDCLPLEKIVLKEWKFNLPKVVDYACWAGHFLTEAVESINEYFKSQWNEELIKENNWVRESIFWVEKDYRLARVAKVSLYMNWAGKWNIIFWDWLEQYKEKWIENWTFDILVANPPYSVSSFKQHLKLKNNELEILNSISNDWWEIETAFIERIAQLLKPKWIAAVILPSSILSNGSESYINARKILLKNFYVCAITQFWSKTFWATWTNTVVLFLEKYDEPPKHYKIIEDTVDSIFEWDEDWWEDKEIFSQYLDKIWVSLDDYKNFISEKSSIEDLWKIEYFAEYVNEFLVKKESKKNDKKAIFYKKYKALEREKLYYFSLVYNQNTLIISSPSDNNEQKIFLWYDWSNRKWSEWIQITNPGWKLYNDYDRYAYDTLASAVRKAFDDRQIELENVVKYYKYSPLKDMLDFSRTYFDASIKTNVVKRIEFQSKYPLVNLWALAKISSWNSAPQWEHLFEWGKYNFFRVSDVAKYHLTKSLTESTTLLNDDWIKWLKKFPKWTILVPKSWASTYLDHRAIMGVDWYVVSHLATINVESKDILTEYLYEIFVNIKAKDLKPDSWYPSLNEADFSSIKIPLPPLDIQKKVIEECSKIDEEYNTSRMTIEEYKKKISDIFTKLEIVKGGGRLVKLRDICEKPMYWANVAAKDWDKRNDYRYIRITDIDDDWYLNDDWKTAESIDEKYILKNWDLLFARSWATAWKTFLYTDKIWKAIYAWYLIRFKPIEAEVLPKYLFLYTHTKEYLRWVERTRGGTAQPNINAEQFWSLEIPLPPINIQKNIIKEVENYEKEIEKAKQIMNSCFSRKQAVLDKYLK